MPRAVVIQGNSTLGSFTSRSLESMGPALNVGGFAGSPLPKCDFRVPRTCRRQVVGPYNRFGAQVTLGLGGSSSHQLPSSDSRAPRFAILVAIDLKIGPPPTLYVVCSWNLRASRLKSSTRVDSTTS